MLPEKSALCAQGAVCRISLWPWPERVGRGRGFRARECAGRARVRLLRCWGALPQNLAGQRCVVTNWASQSLLFPKKNHFSTLSWSSRESIPSPVKGRPLCLSSRPNSLRPYCPPSPALPSLHRHIDISEFGACFCFIWPHQVFAVACGI